MRIVLFNPYAFPDRNPRVNRVDYFKSICTQNNINFIHFNRHVVINNNYASSDSHADVSNSNSMLCKFIKRILFPDPWIIWSIIQCIKYRIFYAERDDIILTISHPFSIHIIGLLLRPEHWILDIGDSFSSNPHNPHNQTIFESLIDKLERTVLRSNNIIIVNSAAIRNYYINKFQLPVQKIHTIYNGNSLHIDNSRNSDDYITLTYLGSTFENLRTGLSELKILEILAISLPNIKFQFIGRFHQQFIDLLQQSEVLVSCSSFGQINDVIDLSNFYCKHQFLMNFSNGDYLGLPSKLVEYVQSRLPIINFYQGNTEASINFLENYSARINIQLSDYRIQELSNFITRYHNVWHDFIPTDKTNVSIQNQWLHLLNRIK